MVSLCFSLCLCLGVWCPSFRPASLLCRKPRSESSDSGGEVPLTFPLLYKSVVRGVVGVVGRVASHRQSTDILAPLFAGVSPFPSVTSFFFSFSFSLLFYLLPSSSFFLFSHPIMTDPEVEGFAQAVAVTTGQRLTMVEDAMSKLESSKAHISQLIMNMQTPLTQAPPSPSHTSPSPISSPSSFSSSSSSTPPTPLPSSSKSGVHYVDSSKAKPANAWEGFEFGSISSSFAKHSVDEAVDDLTKHNPRRSYTYNDTSSWPVFPSVKSWDSFQIRCPRTKREFEFTATLDAMVEQAMTALAAG